LISALEPLAGDEHESFGYERYVYHTAEPAMQKVALAALVSGLLAWMALMTGVLMVWVLAAACATAAVVLDLRHWEQVTVGAASLWFRRGLTGTVHRLEFDDIRDLTVDEEDATGPTLRNLLPGRRNLVCRLRVRIEGGRVVALPRTDAVRGLDQVEAVANHLRLRKRQVAEQRSLGEATIVGSMAAREVVASSPGLDDEMAAELRRLRRQALAPDEPPAIGPQRIG